MALSKVVYTDNVTVIGAANLNAMQDEIIANAAAIGDKYTKPSGGIPQTDLASAVQTSLGKADTALQTAPVTSVNSKTGAVSLVASDVGALPANTTIPTRTSQLTNDSNFATRSEIGTPLVAATAAAMTDTSKVYVYTGSETGYTSGDWYYYDGSAWVSGGVYNSAAVQTDTTLAVSGMAADANAVGDAISAVESEVEDVESKVKDITNRQTEVNLKSYITTAGSVRYSNGNNDNGSSATASYSRSNDYIPVNPGDVISFTGVREPEGHAVVAFYDESKTYDQSRSVSGINLNGQSGKVVIDKFGFVRFGCKNDQLTNATFTIVNAIGARFEEYPILRENAAKMNFLTLNVGEIVKNVGRKINATTGYLEETASAVGTTDLYPCKTGDTLSYKLSCDTGYGILATYDENMSFLRCPVVATGAGNYLEGTYTFVSDEKYFRVSGKTTAARYSNYYLNYTTAVTVLNDMEARISALEDGNASLPSYWTTYLESKIATLRNYECELGKQGIEFPFITDTHLLANQMHSPAILQYLYNRMSFQYVINGGDWLDTGHTKAEAISLFGQWQKAMGNVPEFCVIGNHDLNSLSQEDQTAVLTHGQFYRLMDARMEAFRFADMSTAIETNYVHYLIDNSEQKFRTIILSINFGTSSNTGETTWLQQKLTELSSDWTILVVTHYMWHPDENYDPSGSTPPPLHSVGQAIINAVNAVYSQINAHFVGILAGHAHMDYYMSEETNHYNVIATICDSMRNASRSSDYNRTIGTTSEQAMDLVLINTASGSRTIKLVRIGAGDTVIGNGTGVREYSYT